MSTCVNPSMPGGCVTWWSLLTDETAFNVIRRMWRRNAIMAVVLRESEIAGVITKEHVADSVADSIKAYPD
jgi:chloride channel protein, CIC family